MELIYTTISPNYCQTWGVKEALRELIQEGMDVRTVYGCDVNIHYDEDAGCLVIDDDGPGFPLSCLVMGMSNKRDNPDAIGQFGEGMKLACLVLARLGRQVQISTHDFTIQPVIATNPDFGCDVLAFEVTPGVSREGTLVCAAATAEEAREAMDLFLPLAAGNRFYVPTEDGHRPATQDDEIFLPGGTIFVQGVAVAVPGQSGDLLFSYNLKAKHIQSRDRWAVSFQHLGSLIADCWRNCSNKTMVNMLLKAVRDNQPFLEVASGLVPDHYQIAGSADIETVWRTTISELFDSCVIGSSTDPYNQRLAADLNLRLVDPHYRIAWLLESFDIKTVKALQKDLSTLQRVAPREIAPVRRYVYQQLKRLCSRYIFPKDKRVKFVPAEFRDPRVKGCYRDDTIYISVDQLDDVRQAVATVLHEYAHHVSGASDYTSAFQNALLDIAVDQLLARASRRAS